MSDASTETRNGLEIAIVGMACRFPGANSIQQFWQNLRDGIESISFFSEDELLAAGVDPVQLAAPNYVKARAVIDDVEMFDEEFFGFTPREAEITDPQHRLFLECAWKALEDAGYDANSHEGRIGVFGGAGMNTYLLNLIKSPGLLESVGDFHAFIGNDKDFLATKVAYKLNLRGPGIGVQTACSTSLVAAHLACQSLLYGESDMALAGGVTVRVPQKSGYLFQEGMIASPDAHCRAFDARAQGSVEGSGVGIVVLKRLEDAIADGDTIHAVIKGSAINNDGALKVGFTAPRKDGQASVIRLAQLMSEVDPETINYIEAHGTGTPLGDPIEIAALTQAFRAATDKTGFCAVGSVKTNIGHTDAAAGVAGLIKTVLALKHRQIPPSLHFETPNPEIDFAASPFFVNTRLREWEQIGAAPRHAGVSSFGVGGTNAHVVLEEWVAPVRETGGGSELLVLSARTEGALERMTDELAQHLSEHEEELRLADVAHTLKLGRREFAHRRAVVSDSVADAARTLAERDAKRVLSGQVGSQRREVVLMFPGQGTQYVGMGQGLYESGGVFRQELDRCALLLKPHLGVDLRDVLYPRGENGNSRGASQDGGIDLRRMLGRGAATTVAGSELNRTWLAQPALFAVEYALARMWEAWGVKVRGLIGYSLGEYVAACLAGVFELEVALELVAKRARLIDGLEAGGMLAIALPEQDVRELLDDELSMVAINGPMQCVVGGRKEKIKWLEGELKGRDIASRPVETGHAVHSALMEPVAEELRTLMRSVELRPPQIRYLSNLTGRWVTTEEATDPEVWVRHLLHTVNFSENLSELWDQSDAVFLEVGPGQTLTSLALQHPASEGVSEPVLLSSMRHSYDMRSDTEFLLNTLGQLWLAGIKIDWSRVYQGTRRTRVSLPTYSFERRRFWIEPGATSSIPTQQKTPLGKHANIDEWFYLPSWKRSLVPVPRVPGEWRDNGHGVVIFEDDCGVGTTLVERLREAGIVAVGVKSGERFEKHGVHTYSINPRRIEHYQSLLSDLKASGISPETIVHMWSVTETANELPRVTHQELGFDSLVTLAQALDKQRIQAATRLFVVSNDAHDVPGDREWIPEKAMLLGACKVIPQEYSNISCFNVDIALSQQSTTLAGQLFSEIVSTTPELVVAYRNKERLVQTFEKVGRQGREQTAKPLRERGVYLITGGLGRVGLLLAEHLASEVQARLVLAGRSSFPDRNLWEQWLQDHQEDEETSVKIRKLLHCEKLGAEILVVKADVAVEDEMARALDHVNERFGALHGVFHAAGIATGIKLIADMDEISLQEQFRPKVQGLFVLQKVLTGSDLDFCMLFSSTASVLGGLGLCAYTAASLFMDSFACLQNKVNDLPWISVNWDGWLVDEKAWVDQVQTSIDQFFMTEEESLEAIKRTLSMNPPGQLIVSTGELSDRIKLWLNRGFMDAATQPEKIAATHERPNLRNEYVAPQTPAEQAIADMLQRLIGIKAVGIHDSFFEMGGDSLLGVKLIGLIKQTFQVNITLRHLWEAPTVAGLALLVEELIIEDLLAGAAEEATQSTD